MKIIFGGILCLAFLLALLISMIFIRYSRLKKSDPLASFLPALFSSLHLPLTDFIRLNITVVPVLLSIRIAQYFFLSSRITLPSAAFFLEMHGFLYDLVVWWFISWIILIPFILFSVLKRWISILFFCLIFVAYGIFEWTLFEFFKVSLTPLDEVIFTYTVREMAMIAENSVRISFLSFLPYLVLIVLVIGLFLLSLKIRLSKYIITGVLVIGALLLIFRHQVVPNETTSKNPFEYFLSVNKTIFLAKRCAHYISESDQPASQSNIEATARRYQEQHTEFNFLGGQYPFLHYDNTPDVLSGFFNLKAEKPNIVIVICESLSSCFMGENKIFGSFTPFLDSLAGKSLYWPNFLSTADRTFNVLQAVTGSLPPGDGTYITPNNDARFPFGVSLVSYLSGSSYYSAFYYGGDPGFNNMDDFLQHQKIDYILNSFGPKYRKYEPKGIPSWGYTDADLFSRAFDVIDSMKRTPRFDIYLTLSTHAPFIVPGQEYWLSQADRRIQSVPDDFKGKEDLKKFKSIFATILYSDNALREFFESYKKRPDFGNTIFLITGDHAMPELNLYRFSLLERFHVPLIIYSPMLKKNAKFLSVSSHLDITPSLLAMMHEKFGVEINQAASWLGNGIDTTWFFRNTHALPFILNNRDIPEYLDHLSYLSPYYYAELQPGFWLNVVKNPVVEARLKQELTDVRILSKYVMRENKLIPPELYFGKTLSCDTVSIPKIPEFAPTDSVWEFRNLLDKIPVSSKFCMMRLEIGFDFMVCRTKQGRSPILVFDLYGSNKSRIMYTSFDVIADSLKTAQPGQWKSVSFVENIDLSYLKDTNDDALLLYLWNRDRNTYRIAKPKVRILGYY
jgi:phosphoglycerol transferase MdoB-like AlkP superfamily enzyme